MVVFTLLLGLVFGLIVEILKQGNREMDEIIEAFDEFDSDMELIKAKNILQEHEDMLMKGPVDEIC